MKNLALKRELIRKYFVNNVISDNLILEIYPRRAPPMDKFTDLFNS